MGFILCNILRGGPNYREMSWHCSFLIQVHLVEKQRMKLECLVQSFSVNTCHEEKQ
jgi:hypothetical protein